MEDQSSNGRRYPRYPLQLPIRVSPKEPGASQAESVLLRDISLTGFCFVSAHPYPLESRLEIQVMFGEREYRIVALVQRSDKAQSEPAPTYGIAVLFVRGGNIHAFIADIATYLHRLPSELSSLPASV